MSFEDVQEVLIDFDDDTFSIIRNNGRVNTYDINSEKDLLNIILDNPDEIEISTIGRGQEAEGYGEWTVI